MMTATAELEGMTTITLPDGQVFKEQGRLVLTRGKWRVSGAGFIGVSLDCRPGTVVTVQIQDQTLQAMITEVERRVSRFLVQLRV